MKAVVAAFNQEKALVGAFSVLTNLRMELFQALQDDHIPGHRQNREQTGGICHRHAGSRDTWHCWPDIRTPQHWLRYTAQCSVLLHLHHPMIKKELSNVHSRYYNSEIFEPPRSRFQFGHSINILSQTKYFIRQYSVLLYWTFSPFYKIVWLTHSLFHITIHCWLLRRKGDKIIKNVARLHDSFKEVCVVPHKCAVQCGTVRGTCWSYY